MNDSVTATRQGSAPMQGDLWSTRARDYAELQEIQFLPLYESVLQRPEIAAAGASLDVGCGPGLAAQVFAQKITNVSGIDASAAFIAIARQRLPGRDSRGRDGGLTSCRCKLRRSDRIQRLSVRLVTTERPSRSAPSAAARWCHCDCNLGAAAGLRGRGPP